MNEKQINEDRQKRVEQAKEEINAILKKYELDIVAEDMIGEHTKVKVMVQFVDTKKYEKAELAQEDKKIISDLIEGEGDPIGKPNKK